MGVSREVINFKDFTSVEVMVNFLDEFYEKKVLKAKNSAAQGKYVPHIVQMLNGGKSEIVLDDFYVLHEENIDDKDTKIRNNLENLKKSLKAFLKDSHYNEKYTFASNDRCNLTFISKDSKDEKVSLIKQFATEFLRLTKYSVISPAKLNQFPLSNLKWYLHTMVLFVLAFSVIVSVLMNNIPDVVLLNMPEQWQSLQITLKGFDTYVYNFLGYILFMYLFALPYKLLAKSEFKTGQFAFANMLPTFVLIIVGIPLFFGKITYAPTHFSVYDSAMWVITVIFLFFHIRTIKSVVQLRWLRFAGVYIASVVFIFASVSILKATIY